MPHFEKMLYDNALLLALYTHLWRRTGHLRGRDGAALARRVAGETCDFMIRELGTPEGGLPPRSTPTPTASRDSPYVWTPGQLDEALGRKTASSPPACSRDGSPHVRAWRVGPAAPDRSGRARAFYRIRGILLTAREGRTRPARDDKVVAGWNGMAIGALAEAGVLLTAPTSWRRRRKRPTPCLRPRRAAQGVVTRDGHGADPAHLQGRRGGAERGAPRGLRLRGGPPAEAVRGDRRGPLGDRGRRAAETVITAFADGNGGFYDTADHGERLIFRPADPTDNATPSGAFAAADALLSYSALTGEERFRDAAVAALKVLPPIAAKYPRACGMGLAVAEALLSGPAEIAIVGPDDDPRTADLLRAALHVAPPGAVFARGTGRAVGRGCDPAAGQPPAGLGRPGRLRVPRVHVPGTGYHPGRGARGPAPVLTFGYVQ